MLTDIQKKLEPYFAQLNARVSRLEAREQKVLLLLGIFLSGMFLYAVLWLPMENAVQQAEQLRNNKQQLVVWLRSDAVTKHVGAADQSSNMPKNTNQAPLASLVNQTAQASQILIKRFEPEGNNKLRVGLDDVSFSALMLWLQELETKFAIQASNFSLENAQQNGRVNVKLVLEQK